MPPLQKFKYLVLKNRDGAISAVHPRQSTGRPTANEKLVATVMAEDPSDAYTQAQALDPRIDLSSLRYNDEPEPVDDIAKVRQEEANARVAADRAATVVRDERLVAEKVARAKQIAASNEAAEAPDPVAPKPPEPPKAAPAPAAKLPEPKVEAKPEPAKAAEPPKSAPSESFGKGKGGKSF